MMEGLKVTAFGSWNFYDVEKPITQNFQVMKEAEFVQAHFFLADGEDDLFKFKLLSPYRHQPQILMGEKKGVVVEGEGKKMHGGKTLRQTTKAVDQDLYEIPSELLYLPKKAN
ncbi:hypothetical protein Cni_G05280 [Canna indica]|uniref:Uncharacterized protein n=1 Tax=Canna indica TaxID=4628 RepID=A0AAQ3JU89_9LILI|nr:hypothetical protein Cni_G05280 [Canna indica]